MTNKDFLRQNKQKTDLLSVCIIHKKQEDKIMWKFIVTVWEWSLRLWICL